MNTMTLKWAVAPSPGTASASNQGMQFGRARLIGRSQISSATTADAETIDGKLTNSLRQATDVIRESIRDLGEDCAMALIARITELLDPEEWDDDDEVLKVRSVRTLVRALSALDCDLGAVAITRTGNLAVSWSDEGRNLRVECLPDGHISWASVKRDGDAIEAMHEHSDTITNLRLVCEA